MKRECVGDEMKLGVVATLSHTTHSHTLHTLTQHSHMRCKHVPAIHTCVHVPWTKFHPFCLPVLQFLLFWTIHLLCIISSSLCFTFTSSHPPHTDKVSTNIRCTTTHSLRVHTSLFAHIRFVLFAFIFISLTFVIPFPSSPSLQLPHNPKTEERLAKKSRFQRKHSALRNTLSYLTRL